VRAGELERLGAPQVGQQVEALVEPLGEHLRIGRVAEATELVRDRAAETGAEDHPAIAHQVQCGHLPRQCVDRVRTAHVALHLVHRGEAGKVGRIGGR